MSELAVDLGHVTKVFRGRVRALDGVSMRVHRGEIFGLLGPNGAGKSTLVKILMTVIRPTRCEGTLLGDRIGTKGTLGRVGYLPEHCRFPEYLTGGQVLDFAGAMVNMPRAARRKRAEELIEFVGMRAWAGKRVGTYSKGMKQRIGVAQALVNDPELVVLDEPSDGVDPVGRREIREMLRTIRARGSAVLVNSHLLSELEMVCDRVAILVKGQVAQQGTLDDLTKGLTFYLLELEGGATEADASAVRAASAGMEVTLADGAMRLGTTEARAAQPAIDALRAAGRTLRTVRAVRPTLEDLFIRAVTDPETGRARAPGADRGRRRGAR